MAVSLKEPQDGDLGEVSEINVTPFIDVILVLLIIFMVAAPLSTVDVAVDLPVSNAQPQPRPEKPVFLTVRQDLSLALGNDNGFESSNQADNHDATPRATPSWSNVTLIGNGAGGGNGLHLKEGTGGHLSNILVSDFNKDGKACLLVDHAATGVIVGTELTLDHTWLNCNTNIADGSNVCADMSVHNVIGDAFRGATWVSLHNGGGLGWGEAINGGFGMVLDGSADSDRRLKAMLHWDVNNGIARRAWARNPNARFSIEREMERTPQLKVTLPNEVEDALITKALG